MYACLDCQVYLDYRICLDNNQVCLGLGLGYKEYIDYQVYALIKLFIKNALIIKNALNIKYCAYLALGFSFC